METQKICPNCRKPLPPDVPLGLCPECLIKSGFPTGTDPGAVVEAAGARFVPPPVAEIAELFPQLEILRLIGQGGMGAVYKARQPTLDRFVALKVLPPAVSSDPGFAERFTREARALARMSHPHIVVVHDFGKAGPLHYLLMEFVDGANLREAERAGQLTPEQALAIVPQICEALQFAHNEGVVHRDIKPENILLDKQGRVKIADFGIAKLVGQGPKEMSLTGAKDVVGTPHYMAPEQIEKPQAVDHRADIYSLGVVFYEMLTGELPLGKFAPPSKKVEVDVRLDEVVLRTLEKEPARRYQQASQVKTAVETIAGTPPPIAGFAAGAHPQPPQKKVPAASTAMIVAPAVGLMVAALWKLLSGLTGLLFLSGHTQWLESILGRLGISSFFGMAGVSLVFFSVVPAILILFGAFQMLQLRSYAWSVAAGILAIVSCGLINMAMGIWALIVLARPDVRESFANVARSGAPKTNAWPWVLGAALFAAAFILIALAVNFASNRATVRGTVTDAVTGQPIAGARVDDNHYGAASDDTPAQVWTDANGHYELSTRYEEHPIAASAPGYAPQIVTLQAKTFGFERKVSLNFRLQPESLTRPPVPSTSAVPPLATQELRPPAESTAATAAPEAMFQPVRIKAGSFEPLVDHAGNLWLPDQGFVGGETIARPNLAIVNTDDPELYQTERYGMNSFSYPVPNGKYLVRLHFAETYDAIAGPGKRVFTFIVEGREFKDFDVWAEAGGAQRACVKTVNVEVTDGTLNIYFVPEQQNPQINGIEILPALPTATPPSTGSNPGATTNTLSKIVRI